MKIRYKCEKCGSVLKIKEELIGTQGKCPKCKTKFIVPEADTAPPEDSAEMETMTAGEAAPTESETVSAAVAESNTSTPPAEKSAAPKPKGDSADKPAADRQSATPPTKKTESRKPKSDSAEVPVTAGKAKSASKGPSATATKSSAKTPAATSDDPDDFDPVAFLLDEGDPGAKASAGLGTPEPAKPQSPAVDKQGRRHIVAPPPVPGRADDSPAAASAGAALSSASATSANARDLLTKSREMSRQKASSTPAKAKKSRLPKISLNTENLGPTLKRVGPPVVGAIVAVFLAVMISGRIFGDSLPLPELAPVTGTVTLDGQPLENVKVILSPVNLTGMSTAGKEIRLRDSVGVTDDEGFYRAEYIKGHPGAPVGEKVRIWVQPIKMSDTQLIPPQYQQPTNDVREVAETGNNREGKFNLVMKREPQ